MKPSPSSENDEQDREVIRLLEELGSFKSTYPPELLSARRAAFLAQVERLRTVEIDEGLSAGDQEIVHLLGNLKSAQAEYPPDLLAARRSALLQHIERAEPPSVWDTLRVSIHRIFQGKIAFPTVPPAHLMRISLVIGSLIAAAFLGSLLFNRTTGAFQPSPLQGAAAPTRGLPTSTAEVAITICQRDDQTPPCLPEELGPGQDLADAGNGTALPAVSKDARSHPDGAYKAAYVNDGRGGASWVSNSADSWVKIDLGQVRTINTVSLQKGSPGSSEDNDPGQFVIAVALSDVYADGDSSDDYMDYAQVFHSEQAGFSGTVSQAETIRTQFPPVRARFVKITFEKAGAAIEEVGVFLVQPPVLAEQPTHTPQAELPTITLTHRRTITLPPTDTATPTGTRQPTGTATPTRTETPPQAATDTLTPLPTATRTLPPTDTATPVPTEPLPSNTPTPLPTVPPPTANPPTVEPSPASTDPIIVTGSNQTLTFTCNGNAAEVRGHANTITLLGSCSSITVKGNGNTVFWQYGSPVITDHGNDNIIRQL
jgi:hypothetical protein